jgi:DNA polymerase-4
MNSYFASVEQQANVSLRGKPLGVCSYLQPYGCVIAASIEAKRRGMKVGMSVKEAKKLIPDSVFVENDPPKYRAVTSRVFSILHELTDKVEHYSIDEAFLDLTGWYRDAGEAAWALTNVRRRIRDEVGDWLRCSIGIAPTRFLAKTASDMEKPNGLVVIDRENLDEMLAKLDLEDVCGIGPRIRKRLNRMGIQTLLEVKRYPIGNLMRAFGKYGLFLWCKLHAMEFEKLTEPDARPKSVGHSYCVPDRVNREGKVPAVLIRLTERAGRRMRALGMSADSVSISVGFRGPGFASPQGPFWTPLPGQGGSSAMTLGEPASDSFTIVGTALHLLREAWHGERINFIAVTLNGLSEPNGQRRLDVASDTSWLRASDRRREVSDAVDQIRDRYGDSSIMLGGMMNLDGEAPDRIGFRKTEGVDVQRSFS